MTNQRIFRKDYQPPAFLVDTVDLHFSIYDDHTKVFARGFYRRNHAVTGKPPLTLMGKDLKLIAVRLDGRVLKEGDYTLQDEGMVMASPPDAFMLEIETRINPAHNTALEGLYASGPMLCTQCEAEGFRRITYYQDRPDVMAKFNVVIDADKNKYPVLLSNGNLAATENMEGGRHRVRWQDPFPKPCYLFALVAGDLAKIEDSFITQSGRTVALQIYAEHGKENQLDHAMQALKKAMLWDEKRFGREYDLNQFMIVAASFFNAGAMENKGLNIFNAAYVLGRPETATDRDLQNIEAVIAHEYFHNWSGNRVTCRDWFQLSLKEGFTVFRDQEFSSDMGSAVTERIDHARTLRSHQFPEDGGPMAHPIRPDSYVTIDNFYTTTVYEKGAEVVRMLQTIFGREGFRRGSDLYFTRHDGQAVTCDDFIEAIFAANSARKDVAQPLFKRWYEQAGTPRVKVESHYDEAAQSYALTFRQSLPPTPGQPDKKPMLIPIMMGLLGTDGRDLPLPRTILLLHEPEQSFLFENIEARPVPSLLRHFSAPVILEHDISDEDLTFLMQHDNDLFNRWDATQKLAAKELLRLIEDYRMGRELRPSPSFTDAFGSLLAIANDDADFTALCLLLPTEVELGQAMLRQGKKIDINAVHNSRDYLRHCLAAKYKSELQALYDARKDAPALAIDGKSMAARQLKNTCLAYLALLGEARTDQLAFDQAHNAGNMTDAVAALGTLTHRNTPLREKAFDAFYDKWKDHELVIDKWFALQAGADRKGVLDDVKKLMEHPQFTFTNPNKIYALVGSFCANLAHFHAKDGAGYRFLADVILKLDGINPQIAGRRLQPLSRWRDYDDVRGNLMRAELERIARMPGISKNTAEVAEAGLESQAIAA